jgi:hypothetical protein
VFRLRLENFLIIHNRCAWGLPAKAGIGFCLPSYACKYAGFPVDTADLVYRKASFWLHVVVTVPEVEFCDNDTHSGIPDHEVIGVDLGLTHPAVTSRKKFLGSRHCKEVDRRYFRIKRALQVPWNKVF